MSLLFILFKYLFYLQLLNGTYKTISMSFEHILFLWSSKRFHAFSEMSLDLTFQCWKLCNNLNVHFMFQWTAHVPILEMWYIMQVCWICIKLTLKFEYQKWILPMRFPLVFTFNRSTHPWEGNDRNTEHDQGTLGCQNRSRFFKFY